MTSALRRGLIVALLHVALVAGLGAKLLIDRSTRPRVWARVAPVDPDLTFIGFNATIDTVRGDINLDETAQARASIPASRLGWFFVLQEVVGETRFGLDEQPPPAGSESGVRWDNLSWANLQLSATKVIQLEKPFIGPLSGAQGDLKWRPSEDTNAADVAAIMRQKPVLVGVHGRQMLERGKVD